MKAAAFRRPFLAAGLAVIAAMAVAGCATSSSSAAGGGSSPAAPVRPLDAVKLAAKTTEQVNSFTASMNIQISRKPGAASATSPSGDAQITMTVEEQVHPTLLVSVNVRSLNIEGASAGGPSWIVTPTTIYLKSSGLTQQLHLAKPWLVIPVSTFGKSGLDLTQLMDQATANGLLADSQLLTEATSVRRVGTGRISGVPVTEYTGTVSLSSALPHLSAAAKTVVEQLKATDGITTETFTIWVDGNNLLRQVVSIAAGKAMTKTTMTVTRINQPADIVLPPASETTPLPAGALS
jgi:hypothetical protein